MNKKKYISPYLLLLSTVVISVMGCTKNMPPPEENAPEIQPLKLQIPEDDKIYHAAYPDFGGTEDIVNKTAIDAFESLAQKDIAWAYFSNNWTTDKGGIKFPFEEVKSIRDAGKTPFIRMMPRSGFDEGGPDPLYTMERFLSGEYDGDIKQWAIDAKHSLTPLLVEFGTEVNGDWFPWNAKYNGKNSKTDYGAPGLYDGMERFRDVYRHIIDICNDQGAGNITWFYHCDVYSSPNAAWNTKAGYYPGDAYIDWIGVSVYGAQSPEDSWQEFADILGDEWDEIRGISATGKPIAILEWGVVDNNQAKKPEWITHAINSVRRGGIFYPEIKAISYWHENFDDTRLRIDSSPESLAAYREAISDDIFITKTKY